MRIYFVVLIFCLGLFGCSSQKLTIDDLSSEQRTMWDQGLLLEYCDGDKGCLVNETAKAKFDYENDIPSRMKDWENEYKQENGIEPSEEESLAYFNIKFCPRICPNVLSNKKWDINLEELDKLWNLENN